MKTATETQLRGISAEKIIGVILLAMLLPFLCANSIEAGEMTGAGARALLVRNGIDPVKLEQSGFKIVTGELTGAGKVVDVNKISLMLTKKDIFKMKEVRHMELTPQAENREREGRATSRTLNDINFFEVNATRISPTQIEGLVTR